MPNKKYVDKLLGYLQKYPDYYLIIGGTAVELNLSNRNLSFRETKDFDIVLYLKNKNDSFVKSLAKLLIDGGYINKYKNDRKNAYRFEHPKNIGFPSIIELFCEADENTEILEKRFKKIDIAINNEKISAIILNKDICEFAKQHSASFYGLTTLDVIGLIVLKIYAFFENKKLYEQRLISREDYIKHRRDVLILLVSLKESEIIKNDFPEAFKQFLSNFLVELNQNKTKQILKSLGFGNIKIEEIILRYRKIFNL